MKRLNSDNESLTKQGGKTPQGKQKRGRLKGSTINSKNLDTIKNMLHV